MYKKHTNLIHSKKANLGWSLLKALQIRYMLHAQYSLSQIFSSRERKLFLTTKCIGKWSSYRPNLHFFQTHCVFICGGLYDLNIHKNSSKSYTYFWFQLLQRYGMLVRRAQKTNCQCFKLFWCTWLQFSLAHWNMIAAVWRERLTKQKDHQCCQTKSAVMEYCIKSSDCTMKHTQS